VSKLIRYRPVFKGKDAEMRPDESGEWTSLSCYYSLHDRVVRGEAQVAALKAENERLRKAGDAMVEIVHGTYCVTPPQALIDWLAAKGVQP
jgi:hypothetical protein